MSASTVDRGDGPSSSTTPLTDACEALYSTHGHYLTNWTTVRHSDDAYVECMAETTPGVQLPLALCRHWAKCGEELIAMLKDRLHYLPDDLMRTKLVHMDCLRANGRVYRRGEECARRSKLSFRPSRTKNTLDYAFMPINLHHQRLITSAAHFDHVTSGVCSATALDFEEGSVVCMRRRLDRRVPKRTSCLLELRKCTDELRRLRDDDGEDVRPFADRVLALRRDDAARVVSVLCDHGRRLGDRCTSFAPSSPLDAIVRDVEDGRDRSTLLTSIDTLIDTLYDTELYCLLVDVRSEEDTKLYYALQLREDMCLSMALSTAVTCLLGQMTEEGGMPADWPTHGAPIAYISHVSCYKEEKDMLIESNDAWAQVRRRCRFEVVPGDAHTVEGETDRHLIVGMPVPAHLLPATPSTFRLLPWHINVGINHEAYFAMKLRMCATEQQINARTMQCLQKYTKSVNDTSNPTADQLLHSLAQLIENETPSCNVQILRIFAQFCRSTGVPMVLACKSGKDRTAMAVTLEQARCLGGNADLLQTMRARSVRLENCRKNVGKAIYAMSRFQLAFLPLEYRPPKGTFGSYET